MLVKQYVLAQSRMVMYQNTRELQVHVSGSLGMDAETVETK